MGVGGGLLRGLWGGEYCMYVFMRVCVVFDSDVGKEEDEVLIRIWRLVAGGQ